MPSPADTIREALNYPKRPHKGVTLQALAALTELEQQLAEQKESIRSITVDSGQVISRTVARAVAAEADRDRLQAEVERLHRTILDLWKPIEVQRNRYRKALEQIAAIEDPTPPVVGRIARAALATPDEVLDEMRADRDRLAAAAQVVVKEFWGVIGEYPEGRDLRDALPKEAKDVDAPTNCRECVDGKHGWFVATPDTPPDA